MSTSKRKKPAYHHGDLRVALLRSASELLEKQGPEAIVLREVARQAGVSHNAPYRHFESREALLAALAAEGFSAFAARMAAAAGPQMGEAYVGFAMERPQLFRLMFGGVVKLGSDEQLARAAKGAYDGLVGAFRARGDVADPEIAAAAAWSLVHGLSHLLLDGHFPQARAEAGRAELVRRVMGAVRFASVPRPAG